MKALFETWLQEVGASEGIYACAVRFPDQTVATRIWSESFTDGALENASRCVGDVFRVLKVHRLPSARLRWVYAQAVVHGVRRRDDILLTVFADESADPERLVGEFCELQIV